jgi:hypothetical protein
MVLPFWKIVAVSYKAINTFLPYNSAITLPDTNTIELKTCPYKNLCTNVHSSFLHNCPKLEANKMPFSRWMDKLRKEGNGLLLHAATWVNFFEALVNRIIFLISFSECLLVYPKATGFCMLSLYPATLSKGFIDLRVFLMRSFMYIIVSSADRKNFTPFPICISPFLYCSG